MDWKLELVALPVKDVDEAKAFYCDKVGFHADHDHQVNDQLRFVQLTPRGSACSIAMGTGISTMAPGSLQGLQIVVADVDRAKDFYVEKVGFHADHDHQVSDELRFVQLSPSTSNCRWATSTPSPSTAQASGHPF